MANKIKIIIGLPVGEVLQAKTAFSLVHLARSLGMDFDFIMTRSCDIIGNRVQLVKMAQERKATHLLFVDHDMFFPCEKVNPLKQLIAHDKDIIGAWYNFRTMPIRPVGVVLEPFKDDETPKEIFKCNVVGTGFMLIKMSVFDKISEPWFQFGRRADGTLAYGEDAYFCQQAMKAGLDVWLSTVTR